MEEGWKEYYDRIAEREYRRYHRYGLFTGFMLGLMIGLLLACYICLDVLVM